MAARDVVILIHQLLVVGVIGLIGQTFHLHGAPWRVFALATALAVPAAAAGRRQLHVDVVIAYALALLGTVLDQVGWWRALSDDDVIFAVTGALGVVLYYAGALLRPRLSWAFVAIPLKRWGLTGLFAMLVVQSVRWGMLEHDNYGQTRIAIAAVVIAALFGVAVALQTIDCLDRFCGMRRPHLTRPRHSGLPSARYSAKSPRSSCAACCAFRGAFVAAERGVRWSVNLATSMLGVRVVIAFFDLFGSLMDTGIALLASGIVLIAVALGWWKLRGAIPVRSAEVMP